MDKYNYNYICAIQTMKMNDYSNPEIVRMLGRRYREYRTRVGLTQKDVSDRTGISVTTIHKFENGISADVSFSTLASLLRVVGLLDNIDDLLPELPPSPYSVNEKNEKRQRVKHRKS